MKVVDHWGERKYYTTHLSVVLDDGREVSIEVSSSDDKPSQREMEENWDWYQEGEWPCDGHYERDATYEVVTLIKSALDR